MQNEPRISLDRRRCRLAFWAAAAAIVLASCAAPGPRSATVSPEAERADRVEATGNYSEAAELWQQAAIVAEGPDRHLFRLRAAEAWMRAGESSRSDQQLNQVDDRQLSGPNRSRWALLNAELALQDADAHRAEFFLRIAAQDLSSRERDRFDTLNLRLARLQRNPAQFALGTAAAALREMGRYDTDSGVAILQLFEDVPSNRLAALSGPAMGDPILSGWPDLALSIRQTLLTGRGTADAAAQWAARHPLHPVDADGFTALADAYARYFPAPRKVAVLLPFEGALSSAGKAIRDGLVSAFLGLGAGSELRFFPTDDEPQSAVSAYLAAVDDGADWVVGPLRRESVTALAGLGTLGVPALTLNNVDWELLTHVHDSAIFQMSLSQELEAQAIAEKTLQFGWKSALVMVADSSWGERMRLAFTDTFTQGGGTIIESARFSPADRDHGALLTRILKIDQSQDRKERLQARLGISLAFEPVRRDDFDVIFLAASPEQGRQIRPQLRFHDAGSKPVMAMGRIYSGQVNPSIDQDLNGIIFPSSAWQLDSNTRGQAAFSSLQGGNLGVLHALGHDAWNILPWLPLLAKDPDLAFAGKAGAFHLGQRGQLIREPSWAEFAGGQPVPLRVAPLQN